MPSAGSKPFHFSAAPIDQVQSVELNTGHAALCMAGNRLDQTGVIAESSPNPTLSENHRSISGLRKRTFLHGNAKEREIGGFAVAKCIANQFWPATDSAMTRFGCKNPRLCDYGLCGRQLGPRVKVSIKGLALV
jgi:hypothetical protein